MSLILVCPYFHDVAAILGRKNEKNVSCSNEDSMANNKNTK